MRGVAGHGDIGPVGIILDKENHNSSSLVLFLGGAGCQGKIAAPRAGNGIVQGGLSRCFQPALLKERNPGKSSLAFCKRITCDGEVIELADLDSRAGDKAQVVGSIAIVLGDG